jgi:hypothetical protein
MIEMSSLASGGPKSGLCLGLTTRDSVRHQTPGASVPVLDVKAAKKLKRAAGGGPLNLSLSPKWKRNVAGHMAVACVSFP